MSKTLVKRVALAAARIPLSPTRLTLMSEQEPHEMSAQDVIQLLAQGELDVQGQLPWGSNATLLATVTSGAIQGLAVYKPRRGEAPLWDFPRGTLCQREVAAYLFSELLGWQLVPPTVLRDGPYGIGSVQLFIDADQEAHLLSVQKEGGYAFELERLAVFDVLTNNADRKSGHVLKGTDGRLWAIDHGICFNEDYKLRTVLWEYAGQPLRADILNDLTVLRERFAAGDMTLEAFDRLLLPTEVKTLRRRLDRLITTGRHIEVSSGRNVPWPPY
jgi:hypothetical protein